MTPLESGAPAAPQQDAPGGLNQPLRLEGELTVYNATELRARILDYLQLPGKHLLDLSSVTACDTAGLQLLCAAGKSARAAGVSWTVTEVSPAVRTAGQETGIEQSQWLGASQE